MSPVDYPTPMPSHTPFYGGVHIPSAIYKGQQQRQVANGSTVRELPIGEPLQIFEKGGAQEAYLEEFIEQQKIAGLLVLHDGAIRLERYALNHSPMKHWTSQSVAKSIIGTLVGAAIKDGYITRNSIDVRSSIAHRGRG